jgi:ACT domain-containing protein
VDAIRQIGVSEVTYYRWRQEFGGLETSVGSDQSQSLNFVLSRNKKRKKRRGDGVLATSNLGYWPPAT